MQHRRIVDAAFADGGRRRRSPAVETNSISTLVAHARAGLPGITAHTWLDANPLPDDLRAIPLVEPEIEHTIGLVTATDDRAHAGRSPSCSTCSREPISPSRSQRRARRVQD